MNAQHRVVQKLFGLTSLRLIVGTSMGGMNTWMWGYLFPAVAKALMPVACLPQKISGQNLLFRRLMLAMIEADPKFRSGDMSAPSEGVGLAWNLFQMLISSQAQLERELTDPKAADQRIQDTIQKAAGELPLDVLWEFRASFDYDPSEHIDQISVPLLAVNFADDQINAQGFPGWMA